MASPLLSLCETISQTRDERQLRSQVMGQIGDYFSALRWGIMFFADVPREKSKMPPLMRLALSREYNPVLRYLIENHAPIHEELLLPGGIWQKICPRPDHGHVMVGPIVGNGSLLGAIGFTRTQETPAFNNANLADLSALCLHLSTWVIAQQSQQIKFQPSQVHSLTPRELEIAELVAQGLTNAEIARKLWIQENSVKQALKRMYRKLEVSSRAKLVAQLSQRMIEQE